MARVAQRDTVWVLGDQLDAEHPGLRAGPERVRVLMIESEALLSDDSVVRARARTSESF